jgi:hypothetical protein
VRASDDGADVGRTMVEAFLAGDVTAMVELLAPDVVFHSPVADYPGRERVAEVLTAVAEVVTEGRLTRLLGDRESTVAFFTATVDRRPGDGMLLVVAAPDGGVVELTLMVRPLRSLLAGIKRMKVLLGAG